MKNMMTCLLISQVSWFTLCVYVCVLFQMVHGYILQTTDIIKLYDISVSGSV